MKRTVLSIIFIFFTTSQVLFAMTGREIMEKTDKLTRPKSSKTKVDMAIYKGSSVKEKEFLMYQKKIDGNDRVLIRFLKPTQIRVLTHSYEGRDDDQWLRLSSGKVKRIVGSEKGKPFVQSHMTYEDLETRSLDEYEYKYIGEATALGAPCYKVESVKVKGTKTYDKSVVYVRKSDYFMIKVDFYKKGKLFKTLENTDIKVVDGIITPYTITMSMANESGKTVLKVKKLQYNSGIQDSVFSKEALR